MGWSSLGTSLVLLSLLGVGYSDTDCAGGVSVLDHGHNFDMLDGSTFNVDDHAGKIMLFMNTAVY